MKTRLFTLVAAAVILAAGSESAALSQSAIIAKPAAKQATADRWQYEVQDGGTFLWASTKGDLGALGQYCNASAGACAWVLVLKGVECKEGEQHPVLVNTDESASHNVIQCMGSIGGLGAAFAFVDFDRVDQAIRHGKLMGIAIPERDDTIGVARFELQGAGDVVDRMRDVLRSGSVDDESSKDANAATREP